MDETLPDWALIIAGGKPVGPSILARLDNPSWIVAADSGLDQATRLGITPDLVVGDMDSVTPETLAKAEAEGVSIDRYPRDKDATDLELAIDAATQRGFTRATIIGGTGGRLSHTLANALLLTRQREISLDWVTTHATIRALRAGDTAGYSIEEGALVSIVAAGGPAECTTTGLRWPLQGTPLTAGSTRGISNEIIDSPATVSVVNGTVLTIHEKEDASA